VAAPTSNRNRSSNRRDRGPRDDRVPQNNIVIAAFVRAKLLGIKLLTLDARIVLAPEEADRDIVAVAARSQRVNASIDRPSPRMAVGQRADLAYAVRLLEEGSKSLNEARAMPKRDGRSSN
jgi:hypothetical protein